MFHKIERGLASSISFSFSYSCNNKYTDLSLASINQRNFPLVNYLDTSPFTICFRKCCVLSVYTNKHSFDSPLIWVEYTVIRTIIHNLDRFLNYLKKAFSIWSKRTYFWSVLLWYWSSIVVLILIYSGAHFLVKLGGRPFDLESSSIFAIRNWRI